MNIINRQWGVAKKLLYELKTVHNILSSNSKKQTQTHLVKQIEWVVHYHPLKRSKFQNKNSITSTENISLNSWTKCIQLRKKSFRIDFWKSLEIFTRGLSIKWFRKKKKKDKQNSYLEINFMISKERTWRSLKSLENNGNQVICRNGQSIWL